MTHAILTLPSELKLQICLHLSARQITQLRTVHRRLRDFIDANAHRIWNVIKTRELARLREFISYYVTYEGDISFLECFSRWARLREWTDYHSNTDFQANRASIMGFAKHWTSVKNYPDLSQTAHNDVFQVAFAYWEVHIDYHSGGLRPLTYSSNGFVQAMRMITENIAGFTDADFTTVYRELQNTPGGRLSGPRRTSCQMPNGACVFKDEKYAPNIDLRQDTLVRTCIPVGLDRWISPSQAEDTFGVPRLPWSKQFSYVVESDWANFTVGNVMRMHLLRKDVDALMMAAAMEELRIY